MNRDKLAEILAQQRARRLAARAPLEPAPRRAKKSSALLVAGVILVGLGLFAWFVYLASMSADQSLTTTTNQPVKAQPASTIAVPTDSTPILSPATMIVCTGVNNGRMNIHFEPGAGTDVRGYLKEGETVTVAGEGLINGRRWLRLTSPVNGWANARYLCEEQSQ